MQRPKYTYTNILLTFNNLHKCSEFSDSMPSCPLKLETLNPLMTDQQQPEFICYKTPSAVYNQVSTPPFSLLPSIPFPPYFLRSCPLVFSPRLLINWFSVDTPSLVLDPPTHAGTLYLSTMLLIHQTC